MAESKVPTAIERNSKLFELVEALDIGETLYLYSDEHPINYCAVAMRDRYTEDTRFGTDRSLKNLDIQFNCTLCTGALIVVRTR